MVEVHSEEELPFDIDIEESQTGDSSGDEINPGEEMKVDQITSESSRQTGSIYSWGLDICGQLGLKFNQ